MDVALVTGAGRGIGREVAAQLAAAGMRVVVTARRAQDAEQVAADIGRDAVGLGLDVTAPQEIAAAVAVVEQLGGLDVLVSNAAAYPSWEETALTADLDAVDDVWRTNVLGPWRLAQAFAPQLAASANGRIVNVTSAAGSHGDQQFGLAGSMPGTAVYAVTKAAANAMTRKLAAALPDLRVNAVDPGLTATAPGMEAMGARPVAEGAASVVWAATLPADGPTGGFYRDGRSLPW